MLNQNSIEQFKNKKSSKKSKKNNKTKSKTKSKESFKRDRRQHKNKENFSISKYINIFTDEDKKKLKEDMKKREIERTKLMNTASKNTSDSMKKFLALKDGLYDIIKMGTSLS